MASDTEKLREALAKHIEKLGGHARLMDGHLDVRYFGHLYRVEVKR